MASPQINISNCIADEGNGDLQRNILDFWRIINGLEVYANLGLRGTVERLKINSEDCLCYIRNASDSDDLQCTRNG